MEKVFGTYWVINKTSGLPGGEIKITGTLRFTTKEKAEEYYEIHKCENTWYEQIQPPKEVIIKYDFVE